MEKVNFRVDDYGVFALFPDLPATPGLCTSYQHVGQHSSADYKSSMARSREATKEEAEPLYRELIDIGYEIEQTLLI